MTLMKKMGKCFVIMILVTFVIFEAFYELERPRSVSTSTDATGAPPVRATDANANQATWTDRILELI